MSNLKEIFEKQGGMKLIKQYWQSGAFFIAVSEFLLLGKSRTALEILRLSASLKTKQVLSRKYGKKIEEFCAKRNNSEPHVNSKKVWVCWLQGMEHAPDVVKRCYCSLKDNITDREIIVLTEENYRHYVEFPTIIQEKIDKGIIPVAHMSDLLRLELLITFGGTWIDATVFCSGKEIPDYMMNSDLFLFQNLKPGLNGHSTCISNWFITAVSHNCVLELTRELLYDYWTKHDTLIDYFIFHYFFQLAIEAYPEEWKKVVPFSNSTPHILLLRFFEEYDEKIWDALKAQTCFHKLSYKLSSGEEKRIGTFYDVFINNEKL